MFKLFFLILILIASTHLYAQKSLQVEDKAVYTSNSNVFNIRKDDELYKKIINIGKNKSIFIDYEKIRSYLKWLF